MILIFRLDIFCCKADAYINPVNELGVMGKGLAKLFKEKFEDSSNLYIQAAKRKEIRVGHVFPVSSFKSNPQWIIHFPTKKSWKNPSQLEWITSGLQDLLRVMKENKIQSAAIPAIGCGCGNLNWEDVKTEAIKVFKDEPKIDIYLLEPR